MTPVNDAADFTLSGYRTLVTRLLDRGYLVREFKNADPNQPHLILRHDVDMSLEEAVTIGQLEATMGVRATYFVLVRSELYSPFTLAAAGAISELRRFGHEVGLHLDASLYPPSLADLEAAAARECRILEEIVGASVTVISFHRPAGPMLSVGERLAGRIHAYAPRFFREMGYCSDSRFGWHHGRPLDHPVVAQRRGLQLLTHPIWWTRKERETGPQRLERLVERQDARFRDALTHNCAVYQQTKYAGTGLQAPEAGSST
jgi:hypothetical protein